MDYIIRKPPLSSERPLIHPFINQPRICLNCKKIIGRSCVDAFVTIHNSDNLCTQCKRLRISTNNFSLLGISNSRFLSRLHNEDPLSNTSVYQLIGCSTIFDQ